jgi:integrase
MSIFETGANPSYVIVFAGHFPRPRYWSTVWTIGTRGKSWARNTLKARLRYLDRFYRHCDVKFGADSLDLAIGDADAVLVHGMAEDFYLGLTSNKKYTTADVQCWDAARNFVLHFARHWSVGSEAWRAVVRSLIGTGRIRNPKRGRVRFARALPDVTLNDLLAVAEPSSRRNPFKNPAVKLRNWFIVLLLLLCGLRRGEALLLTLDSLHQELDPESGEPRFWFDVTTTEDEDDRSTLPSIKTPDSHRQIPISEDLAVLCEQYAAEHRDDSRGHRFLLTAAGGKQLSAEVITKVLKMLSNALEPSALKRFSERTGGKRHISAHDLRHTCATVRYGLFIAAEADRELALQRMRTFFGWAIESDSPSVYARAAIHDDLMKSWNDLFDHRITALRGEST